MNQLPVPVLPARNKDELGQKRSHLYLSIFIGLGTFVLAVFLYTLFFKNTPSPQKQSLQTTETVDTAGPPNAPPIKEIVNPQPIEPPRPENQPNATPETPVFPSSSPAVLAGVEKKLSERLHPRNTVERANLATVFIETGWGAGSGFFIDKDCYIITNRHVIQPDKRELEDLKSKLEAMSDVIKHNETVLEEYKNFCQRTDIAEKNKALCSANDARERELNEMKERYEKNADLVDKMERGLFDIKVSLIDNTEYFASIIVKSQKYDLALLKISDSSCPCLKPADLKKLEQGKRVFTIGSPMGLKYTVTSGVVSGLRKIDDIIYIQTDAPINPGNSGGPLLNETGQVLGVNTMVAVNAQGIGFATTIDAVLEEFGRYIKVE
jgi:S1-C subfamily serine protease